MLSVALVLSVVTAGPAAAEHETSDDWEGFFDPVQHSTIIHYGYSQLLTHTFHCDAPAGCIWDVGTVYSYGETVERMCEFLGTVVLWGDCSEDAPQGWTLVSSVQQIHDPPMWHLRFCTQPGWGQNPLEEAWGTTDGTINDLGHRAYVDAIADSMWFDPVPVATTINEPPFCGVWAQTTPPPPQAGCDAADARLASLSVTVSGSELLGGFSPGTFSYSVAVDWVSVLVSATAASPSAMVQIGAGGSGTGSASETVYMSQGSAVGADVVVTFGGESCTYSLTVSRPAAPVTDCPAMSGLELVNGVCVPACSSNFIPQFDDDGQVTGCGFLGDCPFDLYGLDNPPANPYRDYDPLWLGGPDTFPAVGAGQTTSMTRTALKCYQVWLEGPTGWPGWPSNVHRCIRNELNISSLGDCLSFSLAVEAVIPAIEGDSTARAWSFTSSGCGLNASAPRVDSTTNPWTPDDAFCESSDGQWSRTPCSICLMTPPQGINTGDWTVTLGDLTNPSAWGPYVNVPLEVSITDWGDASHLVVTATATKRDAVWWFNSATDWGFDPVWGGTSAATTITVPRRSGPPPSDDLVEINVAEVSRLRYAAGTRCSFNNICYSHIENDQFVSILRDELLANDACPVGADCSDPNRWPVTVAGAHATRCNPGAFRPTSTANAMQYSVQGLVGCDDLNETGDPLDPASVQYWPRLWAAGRDTFSYETYGGTATVTVAFTDTAPAAGDVVDHDPGTVHALTRYGPVESRQVYDRCENVWVDGRLVSQCYYHWEYDYPREGHLADVRHYSAAVPLPAADADGDAASVAILDAHNPHLSGRAGTVAGASYSHWRLDEAVEARRCSFSSCISAEQAYENFIGGLRWAPVDPADATTTYSPGSGCTADATTLISSTVRYGRGAHITRWTAPDVDVPGCAPDIDGGCDAAALADWSLCYALWPTSASPDPLVVDYEACDARRDAFEDDTARAVAAGRTAGDYCASGTVTVLLGGCTWSPTAGERAALAAEVGWHSFIEAGPAGPAGKPWPPHPELPGGYEHIVIAHSPIWPRVDDPADLDVSTGAGCLWSAEWLQASVTQMLPWIPAHRSAVEAHGGHASWLGVWDRLSADQQAEAQALHTDGDLTSVACPVDVAADPTEPSDTNASYVQCRWELARPGVWHWQLDAQFANSGQSVTETLAENITWFRSFDAYTIQQTFTSSGSSEED